MLFLWRCGVIDSLTFAQFCFNCGAQYSGLVFGDAAGDINDIGPRILLAPFKGLGTSYDYIRLAQGGLERRARIATVASFLAMSGRTTLTDPATNVATGGAISSFINHMKSIVQKTISNSTNTPGTITFIGARSSSTVLKPLYTSEEITVCYVLILGGSIGIYLLVKVIPKIAKISSNLFTFGKKKLKKLHKQRKFISNLK